MITEKTSLTIKEWSPQDRPREKMLLRGKTSLTDAELIAILLGSGTSSLSALDVAKKILQHADNSLHSLGHLTVRDLLKIKGVGEARAVTIVAALELGRRRKEKVIDKRPKVSGSRDAWELFKGDLMDLPHEEFWALFLNRANRVVKKKQISQGGVAGTVADPKIIFKLAIDELASGIIVAHNHPSGNLSASHADIQLTQKLKEAGRLLEIQVLDHLILGGHKYFSFADEGLL